MKRFHVHAHVADLQASIAFYSKMFGAEPTRVESDYAKWMIEDPRLNFAISTRSSQLGINHLGLQTDTADELAELKSRAEAADLALFDEGRTTCCYARSDKHWITDPQGIAWEHYHTLESIPTFNEAAASSAAAGACCTPAPNAAATAPAMAAAGSACCTPTSTSTATAIPTSRGKPLGIAVKSAATGTVAGGSCCS